MKLVIVESPYAGDVTRNLLYARLCMRDCLDRGEAPYASHLLYTQPLVLDDDQPEQRALGIEAGLCWGRIAELVAVYEDFGLSGGMMLGIQRARDNCTEHQFRRLPMNVFNRHFPAPVRNETMKLADTASTRSTD